MGSIRVAGVRRWRTSRLAPLSSSALAPLVLATASLAADLPYKAPPAIVADSWAGPYIGAYFSAAGGHAGEAANVSTINSGPPTLETISQQANYTGNATGTAAELFAGRNWRFGNWVVGGQIEASITSDIDLNAGGPVNTSDIVRTAAGLVTGSFPSTVTLGNDAQLKFLAGINGRGGYLVQPNLLLYGLAGLEFGHFSFPDQDFSPFTPNSKWAVGYAAGAGAEWKLDNRWSLRAEYRYLHFGVGRSENGNTTNNAGFITSTTLRHDSADIQLGKIGLVYGFGGPDAGPFAAIAPSPVQPKTVWADDWAGPYAGFSFGAGAGHAAETESTPSTELEAQPPFTASNLESFAGNGGLAGTVNSAFAGYNWRMGRIVAGAQVEGSLFSDVAWQTSGVQANTTVQTLSGQTAIILAQGLVTTVQQLRSTAGLVGRAGFLATPSLYLYGLGGVVFGNFTLPDLEAAGINSKWSVGATAGVGGEMRLDDHWSVRAEYRYLHFGINRSDPFSDVQSFNGFSETDSTTVSHASADFHLGQIGFAYKFGGAGPSSAMAAVAPVVPPALVSAWNDGWAGPYLGVGFGGGGGELRSKLSEQQQSVETNNGSPAGNSTTNTTAAQAGHFIGSQTDLFAGYNWRDGRWVWGGQVEASGFSDVAGTANGTALSLQPMTTAPVETFTTESQLQLRSMVGLIGRAGYLARPDLLLYGLAGLELGHFTYPDGLEQVPVQNGKWVAGYARRRRRMEGQRSLVAARRIPLRAFRYRPRPERDGGGDADQPWNGPVVANVQHRVVAAYDRRSSSRQDRPRLSLWRRRFIGDGVGHAARSGRSLERLLRRDFGRRRGREGARRRDISVYQQSNRSDHDAARHHHAERVDHRLPDRSRQWRHGRLVCGL
jgi:opacity protein-like surface antigen